MVLKFGTINKSTKSVAKKKGFKQQIITDY